MIITPNTFNSFTLSLVNIHALTRKTDYVCLQFAPKIISHLREWWEKSTRSLSHLLYPALMSREVILKNVVKMFLKIIIIELINTNICPWKHAFLQSKGSHIQPFIIGTHYFWQLYYNNRVLTCLYRFQERTYFLSISYPINVINISHTFSERSFLYVYLHVYNICKRKV